MIPPSTIMVIYGIFTETNIGKLFAAGVLPGILGACRWPRPPAAPLTPTALGMMNEIISAGYCRPLLWEMAQIKNHQDLEVNGEQET